MKPWLMLVPLMLVGLLAANGPRVPREDGSALFMEEATELGYEVVASSTGATGFHLAAGREPSETLLVIVNPSKAYDAASSQDVREFLLAGGRLFVVDAFGHANSLLLEHGVALERVLLVEPVEQHNWTGSLGQERFEVPMGVATGISVTKDSGAKVLAASTGASFLDRDGNGVIGTSDPPGPFPVLVDVPIGNNGGRLLLASDPNFLASQASRATDFRGAVLETLLGPGGQVVVDESRSGDPSLAESIFLVVARATGQYPSRGIVIAVAFLAGACILLPLAYDRWKRHSFKDDAYVARSGGNGTKHLDPGTARWTRRGTAALAGATGLGVASLVFGSLQGAHMAAILFVCAACAFIRPRIRLDVNRDASDRGREGSALAVHIRVTAIGGRHKLQLRDNVPQEFKISKGAAWIRADIAKGSAVAFSYDTVPALRGEYALGPLEAISGDPLAFREERTVVIPPTQVAVAPHSESLSRLPYRSSTPKLTLGPHRVSRAGDGSEFHALRNYEQGDSLRNVNWKASARSRTLMVNQRVHETRAEATLFLDARGDTKYGFANVNPMTRGARAAMSILDSGLRARDRFRVVVYSDEVAVLDPQPANVQVHEASKLFAKVTPNGNLGFKQAVQKVLADLKPGNPAILISGFEGDDSISDGARLLAKLPAPFTVIAVPPSVDPDHDSTSVLRDFQSRVHALRGLGVRVIEVPSDRPLNSTFQIEASL